MGRCELWRTRGGWITSDFIESYLALHRAGWAHSVECRLDGRLVGGVYGVAVGGLFAGESMFHRVDDASKVALVHLARGLRAEGFALFDLQMLTPVTRALGGRMIPRKDYLRRLGEALKLTCQFPRDA